MGFCSIERRTKVIKPTEHYEELCQGLKGYKHDEGYLTLKDCVAHILLDVRVWARSHGIGPHGTSGAYRLALKMELAQLEQVEKVIRGVEASIVETARY